MKLIVRIPLILLVGALVVPSLEAISPQAAGQIKTRVTKALREFNGDLTPIVNAMEEALTLKPGVTNGYTSKQWNQIKGDFSALGLRLDGPMRPRDFNRSLNSLLGVLEKPETRADRINVFNANKALEIFSNKDFQKMMSQKQIDAFAGQIKAIFFVDPRGKKPQKALELAKELNKNAMVGDAHDAFNFIEKYDEFIGNGGMLGAYNASYKRALSFIKQEKDILQQQRAKSAADKRKQDAFDKYIKEQQDREAERERDAQYAKDQAERERKEREERRRISIERQSTAEQRKAEREERERLEREAERDKEQAALQGVDDWEYGDSSGKTKDQIEAERKEEEDRRDREERRKESSRKQQESADRQRQERKEREQLERQAEKDKEQAALNAIDELYGTSSQASLDDNFFDEASVFDDES